MMNERFLLSEEHGDTYTVELQWLEHLWDHENLFQTGVVRAIEVDYSARSGRLTGISF